LTVRNRLTFNSATKNIQDLMK